MFSITWIDNGKINSVSHTVERVIMQLWFSLRSHGCSPRMWGKDKALIA